MHRYIAAQHSRSHLVFHYLFTLYSLLYCTLLAAMPCSLGRTRVRPTPTPSWFNDELPNSAMHPEEIEGATKTNSLKVNDELLYIAGWHIAAIGTPPNYFFDDAILFHCSTAAGSCYPLQIQCMANRRAASGGECRSTSSLPTFLASSRPSLVMAARATLPRPCCRETFLVSTAGDGKSELLQKKQRRARAI